MRICARVLSLGVFAGLGSFNGNILYVVVFSHSFIPSLSRFGLGHTISNRQAGRQSNAFESGAECDMVYARNLCVCVRVYFIYVVIVSLCMVYWLGFVRCS